MTDKTLEVYKEISKAIQSPFNVILEGESGVGKEHIARLIHQGRNRGGEFVVCDCERTAREQTGIVKQLTSPVFLEKLQRSTQRDTFFIRRIDLLREHLLAQLSDFFGELGKRGELHRNKLLSFGLIGSLQTSAEKKSLNSIELHKFLDSLFCLRIKILPLRERKREIPKLAETFISFFNREQKRSVFGVAADALDFLIKYDWPNNMCELRMEIERAATLTGDYQSIKPSALSEDLIESVSRKHSLR